jgi:hypothetical protein
MTLTTAGDTCRTSGAKLSWIWASVSGIVRNWPAAGTPASTLIASAATTRQGLCAFRGVDRSFGTDIIAVILLQPATARTSRRGRERLTEAPGGQAPKMRKGLPGRQPFTRKSIGDDQAARAASSSS